MKRGILLVLPFVFSTCYLAAQGLYKVSPDEKAGRASLIVEGQVTGQVSYWNQAHTMIYTASQVEVFKVFKGSLRQSHVDVVTTGGSVEGAMVQVSDLLALHPGQIGLFFLVPGRPDMQAPGATRTAWDVYSSAQGFLRYDLATGTASAPFVRYENITRDLYGELRRQTGREYENRKPAFSVTARLQPQAKVLGPSITSFSPSQVNAGALLDPTHNVLTISGSGFGTGSGSAAVLFDDPDDGTGGTPYAVSYNSPLVISWTDTQIQLRVPTYAGTGALQVQDASGTVATAPTNLDVLYSILDAGFTLSGTSYVKESNLMNFNGSGGYTVLYSTSTAGNGVDLNASSAKQTFQRALTTWKELAGFNVQEGGTTTIQAVSSDGNNVIMFDNLNTGTSPLAAGVLAVCYSFYGICTSSPSVNQLQKTGFDIVIRNNAVSSGGTTFTIGPCPPNSVDYTQIDLETVLLHELGHAIGLGHINDDLQGSLIVGQVNPAKLMNYATINSVRRISPDYAAYAGAQYAINPQGNTYGSCGAPGEMVPLATLSESRDECPASFPVTTTPYNTTINFDLVHATSNKYTDPAYNQVRCDGKGVAITNNAYYAFRTNPSGGVLALTVSNYSTTPSSLASCTQKYAGVPVTGVRLAIYQASTCPAAGSFPAPVACTTFSGNGTLANITGLSANTNYLLYLDGIENTKASFSLTFAGSILPVEYKSFRGTVLPDYNHLSWEIQSASDLQQIVLERSDGTGSFSPVYTDNWAGGTSSQGQFNDYQPIPGRNLYRLAGVHSDGHREYSDIVLLERPAGQFMVSLYPNPAGQAFQVQLRSAARGNYRFELYNSFGQLIARQLVWVAAGDQAVRFRAGRVAAGSYLLRVVGPQNQILRNLPVLLTGN